MQCRYSLSSRCLKQNASSIYLSLSPAFRRRKKTPNRQHQLVANFRKRKQQQQQRARLLRVRLFLNLLVSPPTTVITVRRCFHIHFEKKTKKTSRDVERRAADALAAVRQPVQRTVSVNSRSHWNVAVAAAFAQLEKAASRTSISHARTRTRAWARSDFRSVRYRRRAALCCQVPENARPHGG